MRKKFTLFIAMAMIGMSMSYQIATPTYASSKVAITKKEVKPVKPVKQVKPVAKKVQPVKQVKPVKPVSPVKPATKGKETQTVKKTVNINGQVQKEAVQTITVKGNTLYPLKWVVEQFGGKLTWDKKTQTAIITNPLYYKEHLYLNYLAPLLYKDDTQKEYALPSRVESLKLPAYPLRSEEPVSLHEKPIGITIQDNGFNMEYAAYDYEIKDNKIYVTSNWMNTIFLAKVNESTDKVIITYPTKEVLDQGIEEIQNTLLPTTPEEALALWIKGQQVRSGALQYAALSPELKQKVLAAKREWVTGGSSPSADKASVVNKKEASEDTVSYEISIDSVTSVEKLPAVKENVTVKKYDLQGKTYWFISEASGQLDDFSILGKPLY